MRSIPPLWCSPGGETRKAGPLSGLGETTPLLGTYSVVRGGPRSRPGCSRAALWATGLELLPPVHRLRQPFRGGRELRMFVVVVDHLLEVVVVVILDELTVADVVADGGDVADSQRESLPPNPDLSRTGLTQGNDAESRPYLFPPYASFNRPGWLPGSASNNHAIVKDLDCATGAGSPHTAPDALRPGSGSATGEAGWGLAQDALRPGSKRPANRRGRQREGKERNAVCPAAAPSANAPVETVSQ